MSCWTARPSFKLKGFIGTVDVAAGFGDRAPAQRIDLGVGWRPCFRTEENGRSLRITAAVGHRLEDKP